MHAVYEPWEHVRWNVTVAMVKHSLVRVWDLAGCVRGEIKMEVLLSGVCFALSSLSAVELLLLLLQLSICMHR